MSSCTLSEFYEFCDKILTEMSENGWTWEENETDLVEKWILTVSEDAPRFENDKEEMIKEMEKLALEWRQGKKKPESENLKVEETKEIEEKKIV